MLEPSPYLDQTAATPGSLSVTAKELPKIDRYATDGGMTIWALSSEAG